MGGTAAGLGSSGTNGSSLGQDIFIQSGGTATFQINNALTISTPIAGAGLLSQATQPGVIKSGTGALSLAGSQTYLGDTLIQSGIINLNGSVSGDVHIQSGGTLSGNATANGSIYSSGTIAPGNSIGEIFTTNLFLFPTSIYDVEVNAAGDSDIINASGFAQLAGGVVVTPDSGNFATPLTYTIISTGAGVTGQFSSLTSTVPSLMSLSYNPLTVQLTYLPLDSINLTGNALTAANCFVSIPTLPGSDAAAVNNALLALNFNEISDAFEQMSPAPLSGTTQAQLIDAILIRSTYTKHLQHYCFDEDHCSVRPLCFWADGIVQWQSQGSPFGYKDTTFGTTIGADYSTHSWVVGVAFSSTYDQFHWKNSGGKANMNSYYAGLYGRWDCDGFYMNAAVLGAFNHYKTERHIIFGTIDRDAQSQHHGNGLLAHLGFEYQVCHPRFQWTPYCNLDYAFQHERHYTESGAGSLNLHVQSFDTSYRALKGVFIPAVAFAYVNQTPCSNSNYHANFANSSCVFRGIGANYGQNLFGSGAALTYHGLHDMVNASIYYDGQIGRGYWAQDVVFDLTFRF
jgi:outer membrane autotransporter protein